MRVLFISNLFPDQSEPWRGLDNATLLQSLRDANPDFTVKALACRPRVWPSAPDFKPRQCDEWTHPACTALPYVPKFGGQNHRLAAFAIRTALRRHRIDPRDFDILLTPWLFPDACAAALIDSLSSLPHLAIAQGSDVHRYLSMPARRRAITRMSRSVGGIVTRSRDLSDRLERAGVESSKLHPIYNGVDTSCFKDGDKDEARKELGLPTSKPLALFVGNFLPVKGLDLLLEAVSEVHQQGVELQLALIGSGPLREELERVASSLGIADALHWQGRRDPVEVAQHMQASDVVCLSSLNEGVPNVVLETMASGRPLVSTDVGGIHEVLGPEPGMHQLVAKRDASDYARKLTSTLRAGTSPAAIATYGSTFSWSNCARQHLHLMESLIRTKSAPSS